MKDVEREKLLTRARIKKQRQKEKELNQTRKTEKVPKTKDEMRVYNAKSHKFHRGVLSIERYIIYINHKYSHFVKVGLDTIRFNFDPNFELVDHRGRQLPKPDLFEGRSVLYFNKAKKVLELEAIEAIANCLKKRLFEEEISLRCVNVLWSLLHMEDLLDDEISQDDYDSLFNNIRNKIFQCDLVNVLLLLLQKLNKSCDKQHIIIPTMDALACVLSRKHPVPLPMYVDARKEFEIVYAMEKQLAIQQRGYNACQIVKHGCAILECFVVLFPDLGRNQTCSIINTLLVKVYDYFYPFPFYMGWAFPVLELLLKNGNNVDNFQSTAFVIYNFVKKHNDETSPPMFSELAKLLLAIVNKNC
jgi:hypothetical protein